MHDDNASRQIEFSDDEITPLPRPVREPYEQQPSFTAVVRAKHQLEHRDKLMYEYGDYRDGDILLQRFMIGCWPSEAANEN